MVNFSPWPGGSAVTTIDEVAAFTSNLSGLTYQPATPLNAGVLWAMTNGPSTLYRLESNGSGTWVNSAGEWSAGKTLRYPAGTGAPDSEGVTRGDPTSSALYVATERDNDVSAVSRLAVLRYDTSTRRRRWSPCRSGTSPPTSRRPDPTWGWRPSPGPPMPSWSTPASSTRT